MKNLVKCAKTAGTDPDKVEKFKASNKWLQGFKERKNVTVRAQTKNKKIKVAIQKIKTRQKLSLLCHV